LRQAIFSPDYPKWLLGVFAVWFGFWAIAPPHPGDFVLELNNDNYFSPPATISFPH
jgi:hypothetical protein